MECLNKNMPRIGLLLFAMMFFFMQAPAQATTVIDEISLRIDVAENVAGRFQQKKYIDVLPKPLHSRGEFTYSSVDGLVWTTLEPIASRLVFDRQGIRQNVDGETLWEVDAEQPAVVTITRVMTSVLALDWKALQQYFSVAGQYDDNNWQLELIPKDDVLLEMVARITVSGDRQLQHMTLHEANGDRTEISFTMSDSRTP